MPVVGSKDLETTQIIPEYHTAIDLYVQNNNKSDKNTWKKIYEAIDDPYFGQLQYFLKSFLNTVKKFQTCHRIFHLK